MIRRERRLDRATCSRDRLRNALHVPAAGARQRLSSSPASPDSCCRGSDDLGTVFDDCEQRPIDQRAERAPELADRERRLRQLLTGLSNYDYILIDCPPGLNLLTINALAAAQIVTAAPPPIAIRLRTPTSVGDIASRDQNAIDRLSGENTG